MLIEELYDFYGNWAEMSRKLELGSTTYLRWKRMGYIPYTTQCVIERRTKRRFKAEKSHGMPKKETTPAEKLLSQ